MAVEADYVYTQGRHEKDILDNVNLTFDPATGANYPFADIARRAFPEYGLISMSARTGRSSYHALQTSFTKRLSNRWQASATYTLSGLWDAESQPFSGLRSVPFPTAPDLGGEFTLGATDQRHRAVFNGIWQVGRGFQVSGLYLHGRRRAGAARLRRRPARPRRRRRCAGAAAAAAASRRHHRAAQQLHAAALASASTCASSSGFRCGGRVAIDGIAEVFNVFNSPNWTLSTDESSRQYQQRIAGRIGRRSSASG